MNLLNVRFTERSAKNERDFLEKAVAEDPNSAEAWGRLAGILASDYLNVWNGAGEAELGQARDALQKALALESDNPMALHAKGLILRAQDDHAGSRDAFRAVRIADPSIHCASAQEAAQEINLGNWNDDVRALLQHPIDHGQKDPSFGVFHSIFARGYFFDGKYSDAIPHLETSVKERPHLWYNRLYLVAAYQIMKNTTERDKALDDFRNEFPTFQLRDIEENEKRSPSPSSFVKNGRDVFHKYVTDAWNEHPPK